MSEAALSPDATAALAQLANGVTDDPADRQELVDHLTDAALDYTSGRRRPTEADAVVLVERQFGDPDRLADLLGPPIGPVVPPSVACRLIVVLATTAAASVGGQAVVAAVQWSAAALGGADRIDPPLVSYVLGPAITAGLLVLLLRRWRRAEDAGAAGSFRRWSVVRLTAACGLLCAASLLMPAARPPWKPVYRVDGLPSTSMVVAVEAVFILSHLTIGWAWLWWTDRGGRRPAVLVAAAVAWLTASYGQAELSIRWVYVYWEHPPQGGMAAHQGWRLGLGLIDVSRFALAQAAGWAVGIAVGYAAWRRWLRPVPLTAGPA